MNNSRMIHGPASRADGDEPGTPGWYRPSEGNEAWRNGRQGVAAPHSTVEAGEPDPRDPVKGRGRRLRNRRRETCQVHRDLIHVHVTTTDRAGSDFMR
jgi:hypothetical protein